MATVIPTDEIFFSGKIHNGVFFQGKEHKEAWMEVDGKLQCVWRLNDLGYVIARKLAFVLLNSKTRFYRKIVDIGSSVDVGDYDYTSFGYSNPDGYIFNEKILMINRISPSSIYTTNYSKFRTLNNKIVNDYEFDDHDFIYQKIGIDKVTSSVLLKKNGIFMIYNLSDSGVLPIEWDFYFCENDFYTTQGIRGTIKHLTNLKKYIDDIYESNKNIGERVSISSISVIDDYPKDSDRSSYDDFVYLRITLSWYERQSSGSLISRYKYFAIWYDSYNDVVNEIQFKDITTYELLQYDNFKIIHRNNSSGFDAYLTEDFITFKSIKDIEVIKDGKSYISTWLNPISNVNLYSKWNDYYYLILRLTKNFVSTGEKTVNMVVKTKDFINYEACNEFDSYNDGNIFLDGNPYYLYENNTFTHFKNTVVFGYTKNKETKYFTLKKDGTIVEGMADYITEE